MAQVDARVQAGRPVPKGETWPPGEVVMVEYNGRQMTYAQFERARLDALMPPQPRKQWGKR